MVDNPRQLLQFVSDGAMIFLELVCLVLCFFRYRQHIWGAFFAWAFAAYFLNSAWYSAIYAVGCWIGDAQILDGLALYDPVARAVHWNATIALTLAIASLPLGHQRVDGCVGERRFGNSITGTFIRCCLRLRSC